MQDIISVDLIPLFIVLTRDFTSSVVAHDRTTRKEMNNDELSRVNKQ